MLEYTANDVLYLPTIYFIIKQNCENGIYKNLTFDKILAECNKYLEYSKINLTIKNFNKISIESNKEVEGLIKYLIIFTLTHHFLIEISKKTVSLFNSTSVIMVLLLIKRPFPY